MKRNVRICNSFKWDDHSFLFISFLYPFFVETDDSNFFNPLLIHTTSLPSISPPPHPLVGGEWGNALLNLSFWLHFVGTWGLALQSLISSLSCLLHDKSASIISFTLPPPPLPSPPAHFFFFLRILFAPAPTDFLFLTQLLISAHTQPNSTRTHMNTLRNACKHTYAWAHPWVHTHEHLRAHTHTHVHASKHMQLQAHTHMGTHTCASKYTSACTHTHLALSPDHNRLLFYSLFYLTLRAAVNYLQKSDVPLYACERDWECTGRRKTRKCPLHCLFNQPTSFSFPQERDEGDGLALRVSGTVHWGHDCCMESLYPPCYCLPLSPLQTYGRSSPCQFSCLMHTAAAALVQHPILMQASLNSHYPPLFQEADIKLLLIKTKLHSRC